MILVLDCMKDDALAQSFDRAILRPIAKSGNKADFLGIPKSQEIPDLSQYSHIIISGSEASIVDDNPWDESLTEIIANIIKMKKPLLGICYGHQFLVRALLGKDSVRRSPTAEFGWLEIPLQENPIFAGITNPVFMVSHYDEVCNLTGDFQVIASSPRCGVHAFQYKDFPVWGVQFHPEYNIPEAHEIFALVKKRDASFPGYFFNELQDNAQPEQNERIFLNFLKM